MEKQDHVFAFIVGFGYVLGNLQKGVLEPTGNIKGIAAGDDTLFGGQAGLGKAAQHQCCDDAFHIALIEKNEGKNGNGVALKTEMELL